MTTARVTQQSVEVIASGDTTAQAVVTHQSVEALAAGDTTVKARVTQMFVEVLTSIPVPATGQPQMYLVM